VSRHGWSIGSGKDEAMNPNPLVPNADLTHEGDLIDWQAFCLAYYEPILRALKLLRVPDGEVDELAHSFLLKTAEKNFLDAYRTFQEKEAQAGKRARFRTYLYKSLQNHVRDAHRRVVRSREQGLEPFAAEVLVAEPAPALDPDTLYALDVLHQALQALRRHCERTGKSHLWVFFEETLLADEFRGRKGKTRAELIDGCPGRDAQFLDNALTTAKRAFRRFVLDVIPRGLREGATPSERFAEWMTILRESSASQFNLLHVAFRVSPYLSADMSQTASEALVVNQDQDGPSYEEPLLVPSDDELSILLSFRMELPLIEMLDVSEVQQYIPPASSLWPRPHGLAQMRPGAGTPPCPARPVCLMTLIDPTPEEAAALADADLIGLIKRLKSLSKQLRRRLDHAVPEVFAQLLYTTMSVLALVHYGVALHSIRPESLAGNIRWFLRQSWLDDRLRPLLLAGQAALRARPAPDPASARRA
jgi:hypothetical protein